MVKKVCTWEVVKTGSDYYMYDTEVVKVECIGTTIELVNDFADSYTYCKYCGSRVNYLNTECKDWKPKYINII